LGKKTEFKVKINVRLKKMSEEEYNIVAGLWKRMMLDFEEGLRVNLRANKLDYKTFKELDKNFDFASLAALSVPLYQPISREEASLAPVTPTQPQPTVEEVATAPEVEPAPAVESSLPPSLTQEDSSSEFVPQESTRTVKAPTIAPLNIPSAPSEKPQPSLKSLTGLAKSPSTRPSLPTKTEDSPKPSPGIPKVPTIEEPSSKPPIEEEDRATGIAILRQQMLSELKKIRGIIETKEE
jgi:hypothetical protein